MPQAVELDLPIEILRAPYVEGGRDPSVGLDCWGLVRIIYARSFAIDLPSYVGEYDVREKKETEKLIFREASHWTHVEYPFRGDIVLLRILGHPVHVGVFVDPDYMLHTRRGAGVRLESLRKWRPRIEGFYRWSPST
jgi:cell wall-associated NlpC family hydrolase